MSGFEIVGSLLATPQAIRDIIAFGRGTAEIVHDLKHPESITDGLKSLRTDSDNRELRIAMEVSLTIVNSPRYTADQKDGLDKDFQAFQQAIKNTRIIADDFASEKTYMQAFKKRRLLRNLAEADKQVDSARKALLTSVDLLHVKDSMLSKAKLESKWFSVNPDDVTEVSDKIEIFHGHLTVKVGNVEPGQKLFLLEMRKYTREDKEEEEKKADDLAKTLSSAQGASHILLCAGYYDLASKSHFSVVFTLPPEGRSIRSLRSFIQATNVPVPCLGLRVNLCQQLAAAVLQVHTLQEPMVHKNINTGNIVFFFTAADIPDELSSGDSLFLVNWHLRRAALSATTWKRPFGWWSGVYQHPSRQLPQQEKEYTLDHDIYSLGVCMLEILLWKPLIKIDTAGRPERTGVLVQAATSLLDDAPANLGAWNGPDPEKVRDVLMQLTERELLPVAGKKLSSIIVKCLKGMQEPQTVPGTLATVFISLVKEPLDLINI